VIDELWACVFTGLEADPDGVCVEHGETACVVTVRLDPAVSKCVIPGYECTHDHQAPPAP
jgi:hypothetical protein